MGSLQLNGRTVHRASGCIWLFHHLVMEASPVSFKMGTRLPLFILKALNETAEGNKLLPTACVCISGFVQGWGRG